MKDIIRKPDCIIIPFVQDDFITIEDLARIMKKIEKLMEEEELLSPYYDLKYLNKYLETE